MVRIHSSFRVAAPAGRDDVEAAVAVQVPRGHAVPPTDDPVQLVLGGGVTEAPVLVQEQLERSPLWRQDQIRPAIPVHIGENGRRNQPDAREQGAIGRVQDEPPTLVPEQPRRHCSRVGTRRHPAADEQVQVSVAVHVGHGERSHARDVTYHSRGDSAARRKREHRRHGGGLGRRLRLVVGLPHEQRAPAFAVGHGQNGRLVVARASEAEIDPGKPAVVVAVVGQRAAPSRGDQQVLGTIAVHVVPRDARPELAERLRQERLPGPVIERRLDVAVTELGRHVAEPWGRGLGVGGSGRRDPQ